MPCLCALYTMVLLLLFCLKTRSLQEKHEQAKRCLQLACNSYFGLFSLPPSGSLPLTLSGSGSGRLMSFSLAPPTCWVRYLSKRAAGTSSRSAVLGKALANLTCLVAQSPHPPARGGARRSATCQSRCRVWPAFNVCAARVNKSRGSCGGSGSGGRSWGGRGHYANMGLTVTATASATPESELLLLGSRA